MHKLLNIFVLAFLLTFFSCKKQEILQPTNTSEEDVALKGGKLPTPGGGSIVETEDEDEDQDDPSNNGGSGGSTGIKISGG